MYTSTPVIYSPSGKRIMFFSVLARIEMLRKGGKRNRLNDSVDYLTISNKKVGTFCTRDFLY